MLARLDKYIDYLGVSLRAFESSIGASAGVISRAIRNNTDIQSKWIAAIAENYPQLNLEWLLTGNGPMLRSDDTPPSCQPNDLAGENTLLKEMIAEKDREIKQLNREIGALERDLAAYTKVSTSRFPAVLSPVSDLPDPYEPDPSNLTASSTQIRKKKGPYKRP